MLKMTTAPSKRALSLEEALKNSPKIIKDN
jgi:hypothetical protein